MKKFIAVLLTLILVLGATSALADDMKKPLKVGVTIYQFNDNFMTLYRTELEKYLKETYGAEVTIVDGKNDQTEQTNQINSFIAEGVDVLIVNLVQSTAAAAVTALAKEADIPVVYINREPSEEDMGAWEGKITYVGADARQSGTMQGQIVYDREDHGDLNGNGTVDFGDGGDRRICGQATPKVLLGSNISLRYKDFYLSLQMNGAFGHKIFNGTGLAYSNMSSFPDYNVLASAPKKNIVDQNISDYWLERGDYLNFEYLTLGYNIPIKSRTVRSLRLSCSVNNLATITSYSGLTPIINSSVVNSTLGIDDKRNYPLYRTYSVGVSIQF